MKRLILVAAIAGILAFLLFQGEALVNLAQVRSEYEIGVQSGRPVHVWVGYRRFGPSVRHGYTLKYYRENGRIASEELWRSGERQSQTCWSLDGETVFHWQRPAAAGGANSIVPDFEKRSYPRMFPKNAEVLPPSYADMHGESYGNGLARYWFNSSGYLGVMSMAITPNRQWGDEYRDGTLSATIWDRDGAIANQYYFTEDDLKTQPPWLFGHEPQTAPTSPRFPDSPFARR